MKTGLISGASGQDGAYLAELLLGKGYRVVNTSRDAEMASFRNLLRLSGNAVSSRDLLDSSDRLPQCAAGEAEMKGIL